MTVRQSTGAMRMTFSLLAGFFIAGSLCAQENAQPSNGVPTAPPLAGSNSISGLKVSQAGNGDWMADFDYFFTGEPRFASLTIELTPQPGAPLGPGGTEQYQSFLPPPQRGAHHASAPIRYPGAEQRTLTVAVVMRKESFSPVVVANQSANKIIDWPDFQTTVRNQQLAMSTPEQNFKRAVSLIDSEGAPQLREARTILERLIAENPKFDAGYVELARVAMKTNWGPEGLHQAKTLLQSALQIQPNNVNAKILLGYVFSHENEYAKAEAMFTQAEAAKSNNLWLWENWGELLAMQGKTDQAMIKYRETITRPMTHDTYDRARLSAYSELLDYLKARKDYDGMQALYKQRVAEFGPGSCFTADYARFLLDVRGDTQGAIELATGALHQSCDDTESREILGLAEYVKWASTTGNQSMEALNQARIYLPIGPKALYQLAGSDHTMAAAKKLIATGEPIDQQDNQKLTALGYALQNQDLPAARRLLVLGAKPDAAVGLPSMPVAMLPVLSADVDGVRLMQQSGVDYSKVKFGGATALDIAKQIGSLPLITALEEKGTRL
jgi:tetratricopeptide (TPR) repeat protein